MLSFACVIMLLTSAGPRALGLPEGSSDTSTLTTPGLPSPNSIELDSGWQITSAHQIPDQNASVSSPGFDVSRWYAVRHMPATVLQILEDNAADGGTLFLDEAGEMSPAAQAKLLRVLVDGEVQRIGSTQTRTVDVRVLGATHRNLQEQVQQGLFRQDLYYGLAVVPTAEGQSFLIEAKSFSYRSVCPCRSVAKRHLPIALLSTGSVQCAYSNEPASISSETFIG